MTIIYAIIPGYDVEGMCMTSAFALPGSFLRDFLAVSERRAALNVQQRRAGNMLWECFTGKELLDLKQVNIYENCSI